MYIGVDLTFSINIQQINLNSFEIFDSKNSAESNPLISIDGFV